MAQSILIVDDERDIVSMLNQYFCKIGYVVYTAINGKEALNAITKHPDIILLDINMPDMNGFTICEKIRNFVSCPIIFLTARIEDCDKIKGFAVGGVKPFSVDELEARVAAHLRREKRHGSSAIVQFDNNIVIDYSSRVVFYRNAEINFTKKEFDIIEFLSQNKGDAFNYESIVAYNNNKVIFARRNPQNGEITMEYVDKDKIIYNGTTYVRDTSYDSEQ